MLTALRMLIVLSILTGGLYPFLVTAVARVSFPEQAHGSRLKNGAGQLVGSRLLAQPFSSPRYFWPRPSAGDYATVASGASNLGPVSADLQTEVETRQAWLRSQHGLAADAAVPDELVLSSGSGLDPHISLKAARFQLQRVAQARQLDPERLDVLLLEYTEPAELAGMLGRERLNVLALNLALDQLSSQAQMP